MKRIIITSVMMLSMCFLAFAQVPELLYYKFNAPGTSVVNHASTPVGTNPAPITGPDLYIGGTGLLGTALIGTGGSSSTGVINTGWNTNLSGSFTIAFWTSNVAPSSTLYYIFGDAGASSLRCFTNGAAGANNWMLRGGGLPDLTFTGAATLNPNMMHAVYDAPAGEYRAYINGVLVSTLSAPTSNTMTGTGFQIGGYSSSSNLSGNMDEFRIYNRALTQSEITATYNVELGANALDAGIISIDSPVPPVAPGSHAVTATLRNYGVDTITSATVNWSVNGAAQMPLSWTGTLLSNSNTSPLTLGSFNFPNGNNTIKVWSSAPNAAVDSFPLNDTAATTIFFSTPFSGTYTIGGAAADFLTFNDAITAMTASGVAGPVTFDVNAGTYNEQIALSGIPGISAANNVVFQSASGDSTDVVLQYAAASSGDNWVVGLDNAQYFTFQNMTIKATGTSYGRAIVVGNDVQNITISNCIIETSVASSSNFAPIYANGINNNYNTIQNNVITGGYYGIYWYGNSSNYSTNNSFLCNDVLDYYYYGTYQYYTDTTIFDGNYFKNSVTSGSVYGIRFYYGNNATITNNYISIAGTSTHYGIYFRGAGTATQPNLIANNVVNMMGTGTSTWYGLYVYYADYTNVYHNTVNITEGSSSSRGLYTSQGSYINILNNILSVPGGGYTMYISTTAAIASSNNNVLYTTGSSIGYWSGAKTTLADWQTASSFDGNSVDNNPVFASPLIDDLTPLSNTVDNIGTPIASITTDIFGNTRSATTPDAGAIEFTGISSDVAIIDGLIKNGECLSTNDSVFVTISNVIGGAINFATNPLTVGWDVTGPVNSNGTITVNAGTLNSASDTIIEGNGVDLSVPGIYTLSIYIQPNSINVYNGNDTLLDYFVLEVFDPFYIEPAYTIITNTTDTVELVAKSKFLPGGSLLITEICQYSSSSTGAPVGGAPSYLGNDYIEITGVPNADISGYIIEKWTSSGSAPDVTHTFPAGTYISPVGTYLLSTYQGSNSLNDYHQVADVTSSYSSTTSGVNIIKDPSGIIIDVVLYGTSSTIPANAGVTNEWTGGGVDGGSSWGIRLEGPDTDDNTYWIKSTQDPNVLNNGVPLPTPSSVTGFTWSYNSAVTSTNNPDTIVGPWTASGVYEYVASYNTPCGVLTDTATVVVSILHTSSDTAICQGDSVELFIDFPGTGPWTVIVSDGIGIDTISGITATPFFIPVAPSFTTTYTVLGYMDASGVLIPAGLNTTVTVHPLPSVSLPGFSPMCENDPPMVLSGGLPTGGIYSGTGVTAGEFDPAIATVGSHLITYQYVDSNGCENSADTVIEVNPVPVVTITGALDTICLTSSVTLDAGAGFSSYLWSDASASQTISVSGATIGDGNTVTFSVTVTNTFGCEAEDHVSITALDCSGIDDLSADKAIDIWPNPASESFNVLISGVSGEAVIRLLQSTGTIVSTRNVSLNGNTMMEFSLGNYTAGVYYLQIITKNNIMTEKVIIK